jgi:hypothetical protein
VLLLKAVSTEPVPSIRIIVRVRPERKIWYVPPSPSLKTVLKVEPLTVAGGVNVDVVTVSAFAATGDAVDAVDAQAWP